MKKITFSGIGFFFGHFIMKKQTAASNKMNKRISDSKISDGVLNTFVGALNDKISKKDIVSNSYYSYEFRLQPQFLENAYQQSWLAKRIVELPVESAMKNGFILTMDDKKKEIEVMKLYKKFGLQKKIINCQKWADVYGSGLLLLKNKFENPQMKYRAFKGLDFHEVQFPFFTPLPMKEDPYETDRINLHLLGVTIDKDNAAVFKGVPVIKRLSPNFKYFGMSVYQNIWKTMVSDDLISQSVANIIYRSSFRNYKMKGFKQLLQSGNANIVLQALTLSDSTAGIFGSNIMDADDALEILQQSITGLADLDRRSSERLSAATGIPATILLGKSPDGMNATGKGDEKNFYIYVEQYQAKMIEPCKKIFDALIKYAGYDGEEWDLEFNNPHTADTTELATIESTYLENTLKMQQLGLSDVIIKRYLKDKNLITLEEYESDQALKTELDEDANSGLENEEGNI